MKYRIIRDGDNSTANFELYPGEEMNISKGILLIGKKKEMPRVMINLDKVFALEKV